MAIDYKKNEKYFKKASLCLPLVLGALGLMVTIGGLGGESGAAIFIGLVLIVASAGLIYMQVGRRPSDQEFDAEIEGALAGFKERAMEKLGIDPEDVQYVDPVVIHGNRFPSPVAKRGKDNKIRTSNHTATALFFTEHQIHSYRWEFSLTNANQRNWDEEDEFFYSDLANVNITTESPSDTVNLVNNKEPINDVTYQVLQVKTTGGIGLRAAFSEDNGKEAQRAVKAARTLIREKKLS